MINLSLNSGGQERQVPSRERAYFGREGATI
jgi:hypothetical protein